MKDSEYQTSYKKTIVDVILEIKFEPLKVVDSASTTDNVGPTGPVDPAGATASPVDPTRTDDKLD